MIFASFIGRKALTALLKAHPGVAQVEVLAWEDCLPKPFLVEEIYE